MSTFSEADVRRHYDLLQHHQDLGLMQLKAMVGEDIIGIGLFDNEDDFVSECRRYNELGTLYVGINPRTPRLLSDYGGLRNRMRTLFLDVVADGDIDHVTGFVVPETAAKQLTTAALEYLGDVSILHDREMLFPLDEPLEAPKEKQAGISQQIASWAFGGSQQSIPLMAFTRVVGTALSRRTWLRKRTKFRKYRPFILDGITRQITGGS